MLIAAFFLDCNNKKETGETNNTESQKVFELTPTFKLLDFNGNLGNAIKSFLDEDMCKHCLHEMYVDKVRPNYTIMVVRSRPYSVDYLKTVNPLFNTKIAGTTFSVFTGLEDIFVGDKANSLSVGDSAATILKYGAFIAGR